LILKPEELGPWKTAIELFKECQNWIKDKISEFVDGTFFCHIPNFSDPNTFDFNEDLDKLYESLDNVIEDDNDKAAKLKRLVQDYVEVTMRPRSLALDIIIIMNAFLDDDNVPIIDIFFENTGDERRFRNIQDFQLLLASPFVMWYYKVSIYF
jgi:hypothetical protein